MRRSCSLIANTFLMPNSNISPFSDNKWLRRFALYENTWLLDVAVRYVRIVEIRWNFLVGDLPCPHQRGVIST